MMDQGENVASAKARLWLTSGVGVSRNQADAHQKVDIEKHF